MAPRMRPIAFFVVNRRSDGTPDRATETVTQADHTTSVYHAINFTALPTVGVTI
jgi:hypothetical protein